MAARPPVDGAADPQLFDLREALTVSALMTEVQRALAVQFPARRSLWVRGELCSVTDHRSGHCYMELVDPELAGQRDAPVLKVNCWRSTWGPVKRALATSGVTLAEGMVVTLRGRVELYAPRGQLTFVAAELDVDALLGRLAAQRAQLLRRLAAEGLLRRNAGVPMPAVPLTVGLVASPGSEGFRDFVGQLEASGFAFRIRHVPVPVQGAAAPPAIAAAVAALAGSGCDVVVVVRGGGARADLAAFDSEVVARAVAAAAVPVLTGIGHTGDRAVADEVAHQAFVTPTECGQALSRQVGEWWQARVAAAAALARRGQQLTAEAARRDVAARARLVASAHGLLRRHGDAVRSRADRLATAAPRQLQAAEVALARHAARLGPLATGALDRQSERLGTWRRLVDAYDVERQLQRGYTLTTDPSGRFVRSAAGLAAGDELVTRFADGSVRSTVTAAAAAGGPAAPSRPVWARAATGQSPGQGRGPATGGPATGGPATAGPATADGATGGPATGGHATGEGAEVAGNGDGVVEDGATEDERG